ncbi:putative membrane protein [Bacteriovorax sp. BAL6_X]|uniref:hypothetical protein n=1 Tax=Bacteriovorax sp. BAL6_X TaxID=1201290 RepID=UPI00038680C6|nr:hypothetical protein [Bacteriovorax sp. BAL6_X]EPZ50318.1 putative membrane protein [Bacteriovorax sp. BAL6_X]
MSFTKEYIILIASIFISAILCFVLSGILYSTGFSGLTLGVEFGFLPVVGALFSLYLLRKSDSLSLILMAPLAFVIFGASNMATFLLGTMSLLSIAKLHNFKFLAYLFVNLIGLLIFKDQFYYLFYALVISSLLFIFFSKEDSVLLSLMILKYLTLINYVDYVSSTSIFIVPFIVLLLIGLHFRLRVTNSINILALSLLLLTQVQTLPVLLTALSLLGLSEFIKGSKERMQFIMTANISMMTIILSISFVSGLAKLIPLMVLLTVFVDFCNKSVELNHAS